MNYRNENGHSSELLSAAEWWSPPGSAPSPCSHCPSLFLASVCIVRESEESCASSLQRDAEVRFQRHAMDHREALCHKVFF